MAEPSDLQRFQMLVIGEEDLQRELRQYADRPAFVARVIERAGERGFAVAAAEVEAALDHGARAWITRWTDR
jgi:putative hemolysin